jgi:hypothetical protein
VSVLTPNTAAASPTPYLFIFALYGPKVRHVSQMQARQRECCVLRSIHRANTSLI